jgi:peptide deformylase
MNKEIVKIPNPVLKKKSSEVKEISEEVRKLVSEMIEAMSLDGGVGLAAPQIGESKRIIVVQMEEGPKAFFNPRIVWKSREKNIMEEGCLSVPGIRLEIKRNNEIELESMTEEKQKSRQKYSGYIARIFQHEIDHINGILFTERLSIWQKIKRFFKKT